MCFFPETDEFKTVEVYAHSVPEARQTALQEVSTPEATPVVDSVIACHG